MSAKKARYCIGELSTLCNIPQKTLRYYDEIGLFTPDYRDDSTHYRYYSKSQIVNLMIIKTLKQMGFPLKDIRQIISENDAQSLEANINSHLETMRDDIMKRIDQYTECNYLLQKIQNGIDILEASSSLPSEDLAISIEHIPKISLMYDRSEMEGYDYSEMSLDRWISILRKAEHSKHKIMGPVYVTFYEDNIMNKFLSANSMVEFAVHIEDTSSTDDIRDFGDFDAVTMIHIGNYEDIPTSYIQMMKWIRQNGYTVTGPATEEFILSPLDVNDETRRVTKIIIPVEKKSK